MVGHHDGMTVADEVLRTTKSQADLITRSEVTQVSPTTEQTGRSYEY
jgi:hypothetical protein